MTTLDAEDFYPMAHCIGHRASRGCSRSGGRNYYATHPDDPRWCALVIRGLATSSEGLGSCRFHLTRDGIRAVEQHPLAKPPTPEPGREWIVKVRGIPERYHVRAMTRGQARAKIAARLQDPWNMSFVDAVAQVESCWAQGPGARVLK